LWYNVIFVDNINVFDLALWAEKNPQTKRFLVQFFKKMHTLWSIDSQEN